MLPYTRSSCASPPPSVSALRDWMFSTLHEAVPVPLMVHTAPAPGATSEMEGAGSAGRISNSELVGLRATTASPHRLCARTK